MELNSQQRKFCEEYVKNGLNGTQAYLKAYGNDNLTEESARASASRLLTNVNVLSYVKELQEELRKANIMSAEERMEWLSGVVKDINREDTYIKTNDGEEVFVGSKNADLNTKIKAIDTLNKMSGEYRTILDGSVNHVVKLEDVLNDS